MGDRTTATTTEAQTNEQPAAHIDEAPSRTKFLGANATGSNVPAVAEDDNVKELKAKVSALVNSKYGGDYKKAFDHYGADGGVDKGGLKSLLSDAGVGTMVTRGMWVKGVMEKIDSSHDGKIQWAEFEAVIHAG